MQLHFLSKKVELKSYWEVGPVAWEFGRQKGSQLKRKQPAPQLLFWEEDVNTSICPGHEKENGA